MEKFFVIIFNDNNQLWLNAKHIISISVVRNENRIIIHFLSADGEIKETYDNVDIDRTCLV